MNTKKPESFKIEELKKFRKEINELIKYQRVSESLCLCSKGKATSWSTAAKNRDYQLRVVRKMAQQILGIENPTLLNKELITAMMDTIEIMSNPKEYEAFQNTLNDIRRGRLHSQKNAKR